MASSNFPSFSWFSAKLIVRVIVSFKLDNHKRQLCCLFWQMTSMTAAVQTTEDIGNISIFMRKVLTCLMKIGRKQKTFPSNIQAVHLMHISNISCIKSDREKMFIYLLVYKIKIYWHIQCQKRCININFSFLNGSLYVLCIIELLLKKDDYQFAKVFRKSQLFPRFSSLHQNFAENFASEMKWFYRCSPLLREWQFG